MYNTLNIACQADLTDCGFVLRYVTEHQRDACVSGRLPNTRVNARGGGRSPELPTNRQDITEISR